MLVQDIAHFAFLLLDGFHNNWLEIRGQAITKNRLDISPQRFQVQIRSVTLSKISLTKSQKRILKWLIGEIPLDLVQYLSVLGNASSRLTIAPESIGNLSNLAKLT